MPKPKLGRLAEFLPCKSDMTKKLSALTPDNQSHEFICGKLLDKSEKVIQNMQPNLYPCSLSIFNALSFLAFANYCVHLFLNPPDLLAELEDSSFAIQKSRGRKLAVRTEACFSILADLA